MASSTPPTLPGMHVTRALGRGNDGPWMAKADDGTWVVVRAGARPPTLPEHDVLLPVLGSATDVGGARWTVTAYVPGSGLDRRVDRLGVLTAGEAASWLSRVADALGALHADGLVHGHLSAARVLLGPGDRVLLDATCASAGGPAEKAHDMEDLGELALAIVGADERGAFVRAAQQARDGALDAESFARSLQGIAKSIPRGRRQSETRQVRRVGVLIVAGCAAVVLAASLGSRLVSPQPHPAVLPPSASGPPSVAATAAQTADPAESSPVSSPSPSVTPTLAPSTGPPSPRSSPGGSASVPTPTPRATPASKQSWTEVLTHLDSARGRALAEADPSQAARFDAPGTQAYRRDRAVLGALDTQDLVVRGWKTELLAVRPRTLTRDHVELLVVDRLAAHSLLASDGTVVERRSRRGPAHWVVRLNATPDGWRIARVTAASP